MTSIRELDSYYLLWLYTQIDNKTDMQSADYTRLMRAMYETEFTWSVDFDANRAEDGKQFRRDFALDRNINHIPSHWAEMPCSFLELVFGLADRMAMMLDMPIGKCFWHLLENAELSDQSNENFDSLYVEDKIFEIIDRVYEYNGEGGFFPLNTPPTDQTKVELLYQMYSYVQEFYD